MLTQADLEARGWIFTPPTAAGPPFTETVPAPTKDDPNAVEVITYTPEVSTTAEQTPLFFLIRGANHLEGDDGLMDAPITPTLVQQVSGETWTPEPAPPTPVATAEDHAVASAALITEKLASIPITVDQLSSILESLLGEASSGIPFFEKYALDPSMTSPQWVAFQALDQKTKDRLLYDVIRSLAALMRYLTGDLA